MTGSVAPGRIVLGPKSVAQLGYIARPKIAFNCGTQPPPYAATRVKVCVSPPVFLTKRFCPAVIRVRLGVFVQPTAFRLASTRIGFAVSAARNSVTVTCTPGVAMQVPGGKIALNVAGSHRSETVIML